ncbi:MAG: hypothetical protein A3A97_00210 [Candidatus Terrybacteria bacterium RIFCSPLOWO2_01_FULL_40_23]|uniref:Uncharacterized protein n=1 Tax=Candidatus Terrybacteria bacterium RIFCSPLOWO2_01_FULL_40_23 TaxID=1802366 RepID=A0A1G2PW36_9BACT|nr:MAG: hypothetical protein A3A97_00210 [Candidatus Terrybacteria bacterium RIFCSPLOWO2_01_FULL_40_23]
MKIFVIKITSDYSDIANFLFGPFTSENGAKTYLLKKGWIEDINDETGVWYAQISRYTGVNAIIEKLILRKPKDLPTCKG